MSPPDTCALCYRSDTNDITGRLQRTPDGSVVAHYNCMLYSPKVISIDSQEDVEGFDFAVESVLNEIKRGQKLRCNFCKKRGATVGCDIRSCRRNYHFPCVIEAKGSPSLDEYVVYCFKHNLKKTDNGIKNTPRGRKRKRIYKTDDKPRKNNVKRRHNNNNVDSHNVQMHANSRQQPEGNFILCIHSAVIALEEEEEEDEEDLPSTSFQQPTMSSDTSSEESDSILSPKVKEVFSLSGLPKNKAKYSSNRKPNEKLQEVLQMLSAQEKADLSQVYSELGGSQHLTIEMASTEDYQNDAITTEDAPNTDVTDTSSDSDGDRTPERLPDNHMHVSPSRSSMEEQHVTEEQPVSFPDEEIPDKTSASSKLPTQLSYSNIEDRPCMSTLDEPSSLPNSLSSEFPDSTILLIIQSMTQITGNSVAHAVGLSNDTGLPTQQIHSTNSKETLSSQPTDCTDASKSIRPDTLVGCSLNSVNEQPANDLAAQGTSETHPSGCPSVTEPESPFCSSLTLEKDRNKTEVSTSVSDVSQENMESDVSAPLCYNREILPVASPSNGKTMQNEKGPKKGTISNIISPKQITALSRNLVTERLKSIVPQIQRVITTPKRNGNMDTEQRRDGEAISEGSTNPSANDQPAGNYEPLKNQDSSDDSIKEVDLMCQERSKSITPKRKRSQDSVDLLPNRNPQQTEGNLPEQLEIPEEQDENNFRENATQGSLESERASEHQPGPSRMTRAHRRRPYSSRQSGFQRERVDDPDGIDGFGSFVADQCRSMPQDRKNKYMSYVLASADLFRAYPTIPEIDILLSNLRTVLDRSQQSSPFNAWGSQI